MLQQARSVGFFAGLWLFLLFAETSLAQEPVSKDLIKLYETTSKLTTEEQFSDVIDRCTEVVLDLRRSKADKAYASQLLSWGANKRGELLSDMAGEMVVSGKLDQASKFDQAASDDFLLSLKHDPGRWKARHNYAVSLAMQKKFTAAISEFSKVLEQNPKYPNAFFNRGELYFQRKEYDLAIADFTAGIQLAPKDSQSYSSRAHAKFMLEQYDSALADYRAASQLQPKNAALATDYADACQSLFRWKEATEGYRMAMSADENYVRCLQNAAWMLASCPEAKYRNPKEALELAELSAELGEVDAHQLDVMAVCQASNGNFAQAIAASTKALEKASHEDAEEIEQRLNLFRKKKPYLQAVPSTESKSTVRTASQPVGTGIRP